MKNKDIQRIIIEHDNNSKVNNFAFLVLDNLRFFSFVAFLMGLGAHFGILGLLLFPLLSYPFMKNWENILFLREQHNQYKIERILYILLSFLSPVFAVEIMTNHFNSLQFVFGTVVASFAGLHFFVLFLKFSFAEIYHQTDGKDDPNVFNIAYRTYEHLTCLRAEELNEVIQSFGQQLNFYSFQFSHIRWKKCMQLGTLLAMITDETRNEDLKDLAD